MSQVLEPPLWCRIFGHTFKNFFLGKPKSDVRISMCKRCGYCLGHGYPPLLKISNE